MIRRPVDDMVDAHFFAKEGATHAPDDKHYLISSKGNRSNIPLAKSCANFNGIDNEVSFAAELGNTGGQTIGFYIYLTSSVNQDILFHNGNRVLAINQDTQQITLGLHDGLNTYTDSVFTINLNGKSLLLNTWMSIIFVGDYPNKIYIDGVLASTITALAERYLYIDQVFPTENIKLYEIFYYSGDSWSADAVLKVSNFNYKLSVSTFFFPKNFYHFEEKEGSIIYDTSANANHGTLSGDLTNFWYKGADVPHSFANEIGYNIGGSSQIIPASSLTTDALGNPLEYLGQVRHMAKVIDVNVGSFDSVGYIQIPHDTSLNIGNGTNNPPYSITVKIQIADTIFGRLISKGDLSGNVSYLLAGSGTNVIWGQFNGGSRIGVIYANPFSAHLNELITLVCLANGTPNTTGFKIRAYDSNGIEFAMPTPSSYDSGAWDFMRIGQEPLYFGNYSTAQYTGIMSDVKIYTTELTDPEIDKVLKGEYIGNEISHWSFNEGQGTTVYDLLLDNDGIWINHTDPNQWGKNDDAIDYFLLNNLKINPGGTALEKASGKLINTGSKIDFNPYLALGENVPRAYAFGDALDANANMYINQLSRLPSYFDMLIYNRDLQAGDETDRVNNYIQI